MRSPAAAIAWELRQGHRIALIALAALILVLGMIRLLIPGPWEPIELDTPNETAALLILPFSVTFMYLLAVFSFGLAGDLAARPSIYPARMFTLPVTTRALEPITGSLNDTIRVLSRYHAKVPWPRPSVSRRLLEPSASITQTSGRPLRSELKAIFCPSGE